MIYPLSFYNKITDPDAYNNPNGTWHVTTEGDTEGRSTKDLGIHEGHVVEIAYKLAHKAYYGLRFDKLALKQPYPEAVVEEVKELQPPKSVNISFDISSNTWDNPHFKGAKTEKLPSMIGEHPLLKGIERSNYYACTKLVFKNS